MEHEADHLLTRLRRTGIDGGDRSSEAHRIHLSDTEVETARLWLRDRGVVGSSGPIIGVGPGSKWPSKIWPTERFGEVLRRMQLRMGAVAVTFGGREDRRLGEEVLARAGAGVNAAGELSVRQAAALLSLCAAYLGNDTGTMHLAAAVGTPCVVVFSAQDWPGRWEPLGGGHTVIRKRVPCEGCLLATCGEHALRCLTEIEPDEVAAALERTTVARWPGQAVECG